MDKLELTELNLGRVFNSKLSSFAAVLSACILCIQPLLELKIWLMFCPVSTSVSILYSFLRATTALNDIHFLKKIIDVIRERES